MATDSSQPEALASGVLAAYEGYDRQFHVITRFAQRRFEERDWTGSVADALARLRLYKVHIDAAIGRGRDAGGSWEAAKAHYRTLVEKRYDSDLALMFFDSVHRALSPSTIVPYGADTMDQKLDPAIAREITRRYEISAAAPLHAVIPSILAACGFKTPYRDLEGDAAKSADAVAAGVRAAHGSQTIRSIDVLLPLFYRNKGAYVIGRLHTTEGIVVPLALALAQAPEGIVVDAVLTEESDLRRIFSYTRSNFHVELKGQYREVLDFLRSLMPHKNWAALYSSIGFMNPAKIQLWKDLEAHRQRPSTKLTAAWGIPGLVMVVFTAPGFPYVFKVIRDDDKVTKLGYIGHQGVTERYRLVQEGDRVGRLLDTITFHHLRFRRSDFEPKILQELLDTAADSVKAVGDEVSISRCYAQREATPVPIYLRQNEWPEIERVLNDLGGCLKQIAAAGLFPGEFDLKNFGVAEDGRVVFFDFDGLGELRRFSFDRVPLAASLAQEECFEYLLNSYRVSLVKVFRDLHPELFAPEYWQGIQKRLREGEVLDTFPYPAHKRLSPRRPAEPRASGHLSLPLAVDHELERLGLKTAHRRGRLSWEVLGGGVAVGRGASGDLTSAQRDAVQKAFAIESAPEGEWGLGVIVVDDVPAFVYLPELSKRVIDLSGQYTVERAVADEWRERVRGHVFRESVVDFVDRSSVKA